MENLEKLKELTKVNINDTTSVDNFFKEFVTLNEEEQLTLANYFVDNYEYHESTEDDDDTMKNFLRNEYFVPTFQKLHVLVNESNDENHSLLDKISENCDLLTDKVETTEEPSTEETSNDEIEEK